MNSRTILPTAFLLLGLTALLGAASFAADTGTPIPPATPPGRGMGMGMGRGMGPGAMPGVKMWFSPLPSRLDGDAGKPSAARIALGRTLYYDPRLSKDSTVSCNSCHSLTNYGVDGRKTSPGVDGQLGARNSPTVYNAGGYVAQFWDGRAPNIEEQAKGPILNPVEMAMPDPQAVVDRLASIPGYPEMFAKAFPGEKKPLTYDNMAKAIGAFERGLVTPGRFDKWLSGDTAALSAQELDGLRLFQHLGCTTCHNGEAVGGKSLQRLGLVLPYPDQHDLGRYGVTKAEADKMVFKVPSLRNIEKTGPWFHDGSQTDLPNVVRTMAKHQLGREDLTDAQVDSIVAFLKSLTGEIPPAYIAEPKLPGMKKQASN